MRDIEMPPPTTLCTAPPDIVISDAAKMLTSSAVASDAEITAAWSTSADVIWIGLVLSELQAAARTSASIGALTENERLIEIPSLGLEGAEASRCGPRRWDFSLARRPLDVWACLALRDSAHT
jgi:hypothetical protein